MDSLDIGVKTPDSRPDVCIVEFNPNGHRLAYVKHVIMTLDKEGTDWHFITSAAVCGSVEFSNHLSPLRLSAQRITILPGARMPSEVLRLPGAQSARRVVFPDADRYLRPMVRRLARPKNRAPEISLLIMQYPSLADFHLTAIAKRLAANVLGLQPGVSVFRLVGPTMSGSARGLVRPIGDPVSISSQAPIAGHDFPAFGGSFVFLIVGALAEWKNPALVIQAFRECAISDAVLVLAGPLSPSIAEIITRLSASVPGVHLVDRLLSEEEFDCWVAMADCVVLAYSTHAPNSTAGKAAVLGTRVLGAGSRRFLSHLSKTCPEAVVCKLSSRSMARGMARARNSPQPLPKYGLVTPKEFTLRLIGAIPK